MIKKMLTLALVTALACSSMQAAGQAEMGPDGWTPSDNHSPTESPNRSSRKAKAPGRRYTQDRANTMLFIMMVVAITLYYMYRDLGSPAAIDGTPREFTNLDNGPTLAIQNVIETAISRAAPSNWAGEEAPVDPYIVQAAVESVASTMVPDQWIESDAGFNREAASSMSITPSYNTISYTAGRIFEMIDRFFPSTAAQTIAEACTETAQEMADIAITKETLTQAAHRTLEKLGVYHQWNELEMFFFFTSHNS